MNEPELVDSGATSPARKLGPPPRGWTARLARLPIQLYRHGFGFLLGSRFLLLIHRGRRTGKKRYAVLEVVARDRGAGLYFVASPWQERADWFANVAVVHEVTIMVGRRRIKATAEILSREESDKILRDYGKRHRLAAWTLARIFGHSDFDSLLGRLRVVAFHSP